ncbi:hypothetical protein LCGC14_0686490 [marine sediment metagenome]|uniref:Uncharacterized protein n=1 Tax=marine sediment metagenome TaxID=412755 RepID=A0A0F9QLS0_9ZZZZ|nr:hypothetical protein [Methylophaga sp.]
MADDTIDDASEDASLDEDNANATSKRFSKPTLIKIAIGIVLLLLIAGAAYFFFMPEDQAASQETKDTLDDATTAPEQTSPTTDSDAVESDSTLENQPNNKEYSAEQLQLLKLREEAVALKEENLKMKERLNKLEEEQNPNIEASKPEISEMTNETLADEENDGKTTSIDTQPKTKQNQYSNLYIKEKAAAQEPQSKTTLPVQRERDITPPPAPKWGEFSPTYNGK